MSVSVHASACVFQNLQGAYESQLRSTLRHQLQVQNLWLSLGSNSRLSSLYSEESFLVNPLERLNSEELVQMANADFQVSIRSRAKALSAKALDVIEDIMSTSEEDDTRLAAATKVLSLAGVSDATKSLPLGVSEEVFRLALSGLGQLAGIASASTHVNAIMRNVTPAATDPRKRVDFDDSPLNVKPKHSEASPSQESLDDFSVDLKASDE